MKRTPLLVLAACSSGVPRQEDTSLLRGKPEKAIAVSLSLDALRAKRKISFDFGSGNRFEVSPTDETAAVGTEVTYYGVGSQDRFAVIVSSGPFLLGTVY